MVKSTKSSKFNSTVEYMGDQKAKTAGNISFGTDDATFVKFWT